MKRTTILMQMLFLFLATGAILTGLSFAEEPSTPGYPPAPAYSATKAPSASEAAPGLTIARMEFADSVMDREPSGVATTFPATQEKVYCYVEFRDVPEDTSITYVWSLGQNEMARVEQQIGKSSRWRTWSSKTIAGMKGDWKVDVLDSSGNIIKSGTFTVE